MPTFGLARLKRRLTKRPSLDVQKLLQDVRIGTITSFPTSLDQWQAQELAVAIVYKNKHRPKSLEKQYEVLANISDYADLSPGVRLNAAIATTHKALELCDTDRVHAAKRALVAKAPLLSELDACAAMRENSIHVQYSLAFVQFNAALFLHDQTELRDLSAKTPYAPLLHHPQVPSFFFRTIANVARCHGFTACLLAKEGDYDRLEVLSASALKSLSDAFDARQRQAKKSDSERRDTNGVWLADVELRRASAIIELIEQLKSDQPSQNNAEVRLLAKLCVTSRTENQRRMLMDAWHHMFLGQ